MTGSTIYYSGRGRARLGKVVQRSFDRSAIDRTTFDSRDRVHERTGDGYGYWVCTRLYRARAPHCAAAEDEAPRAKAADYNIIIL